MHARAVQFQAKADRADEMVRIYQDSVIPAASQQRGFRGAVLLTDRAKGRATSITFWESEADLLQGETSGYYQAQIDKIKPMMTAAPVREVYEVSAQTLVQPGMPGSA